MYFTCYPQVFELLFFKNYTFDSYKEVYKQLDFPNYKTFNDVNGTYSSFVRKIMTVIDKIAPYRNKQINDLIPKV